MAWLLVKIIISCRREVFDVLTNLGTISPSNEVIERSGYQEGGISNLRGANPDVAVLDEIRSDLAVACHSHSDHQGWQSPFAEGLDTDLIDLRKTCWVRDETHIVHPLRQLGRDLDTYVGRCRQETKVPQKSTDETGKSQVPPVVLAVLQVVLLNAVRLMPQVLLILKKVMLTQELMFMIFEATMNVVTRL